MKRIIIYDLHHKSTNDYKKLYETLKGFNSKQLNESAYVIDTKCDKKIIEKALKLSVEPDDIVYFISVNCSNNLFWEKI